MAVAVEAHWRASFSATELRLSVSCELKRELIMQTRSETPTCGIISGRVDLLCRPARRGGSRDEKKKASQIRHQANSKGAEQAIQIILIMIIAANVVAESESSSR